jgi:hypothetical protein
MPQVFADERRVINYKPEELLALIGCAGFTIDSIHYAADVREPYIQFVVTKGIKP